MRVGVGDDTPRRGAVPVFERLPTPQKKKAQGTYSLGFSEDFEFANGRLAAAALRLEGGSKVVALIKSVSIDRDSVGYA